MVGTFGPINHLPASSTGRGVLRPVSFDSLHCNSDPPTPTIVSPPNHAVTVAVAVIAVNFGMVIFPLRSPKRVNLTPLTRFTRSGGRTSWAKISVELTTHCSRFWSGCLRVGLIGSGIVGLDIFVPRAVCANRVLEKVVHQATLKNIHATEEEEELTRSVVQVFQVFPEISVFLNTATSGKYWEKLKTYRNFGKILRKKN